LSGFPAAIVANFASIMKIVQVLLFLVFGFAVIPSLLAESVVAPGAKLKKLAGDFAFTEGPTCDPAGNLFLVDQPNNRIME